MFITIALIVIVLATFLLIMVNMFSDYSARREQDMRLLVTHAHNVVAETEELLLNQSQLPYSRTLVLVLHYRIVRALKKRAIDPKSSATVRERIAEEERLISEIKSKQHESLAFKPPENDSMAVNQLRAIKKLRAILKSEIKTGIPINPVEIQKEDRRLYVLVMKVNISNLVQKVMEMKRLHRSPLFGVNIGTVNSLDDALATKGAKRAADRPVRYLIVSDPMFRGYLDEFIEWKRRVGFVVDVAYTDESDVGNTQESIKSYVKSQYDNATDDKPAPSFLLLVGDIEQVPAKSYTYGEDTHVSDLDYALWTAGDNIPDCLYGRFSAQTVSQLYTQLQKTLLYEKYEFDDDSFLDRAILVAGVDGGTEGDLGYTHADPTMDYLAKNYVNGDEKTVLSGDDFYGYTSVMEYKNDPSISQGATGVTVMSNSNDVDFRQQCNNGAGFINYTAHGYEQGWAEPGLSNSDVSHMMNARKSGLMIGNCCLTGKFDEPVCFGEALLRRENHCGAVGYIGGSNYTYWGEDFYWAVGYRSSITATMSMNYIASKTGVYDHIFHTHGENYQSWATTLGSIVQQGNMSVQNSNSGLKDYYWQIYHAFGDPSLMPWLTRAKDMPLSYTGMAFGSTEIQVSSAPYAYVALTTADNALLGVAVADIGGNATISLSQPLTEGEYVFAATAQNYKPALLSVSLSSPNVNGCDSKYDINLSIYPNPVANVLNVKAPGLQRVVVADAVGRIVLDRVGDGSIDMSGFPSGVYTVRVTANGVVAVRKVIKN